MVEHFHMAFGLYIQGLVHCRSPYQYRYVAVQHVHLLLGVCYHRAGCPDTGYADDDASYEESGTYDADQLDFVFQILDDHRLLFFYGVHM